MQITAYRNLRVYNQWVNSGEFAIVVHSKNIQKTRSFKNNRLHLPQHS